MPTFEIKNRYTNNVIWKCEADNFKKAIETAVAQNINLCDANLQKVNLQGANLQGANLQGADIREANFWKTNLRGANLREAYLSGANLPEANLQRANLQRANLRGAILTWTNLRKANLQGADLYCANLGEANLQEADVQMANLQGTNLWGANLEAVNFPKFQIPQRKSLIVYKKLRHDAIATLRIPSRAARTASLSSSSPLMRSERKFGKCRAERAFVVAIEDQGRPIKAGYSWYNDNFIYEVRKVKTEPYYDPDIRIECTFGIHFFMTKEEAEEFRW